MAPVFTVCYPADHRADAAEIVRPRLRPPHDTPCLWSTLTHR
jgi:hypothetical protein